MAIRAGMEQLVNRVRKLIGDPWATDCQYDDDEIQDALDRCREESVYVMMTPQVSIAPGGAISYTQYYWGANWGGTPVITDSGFGTITPATSDLARGYYTFATEPARPIYISGTQYDVLHAAAELLEQWATTLALEVDYKDPNYSFTLSQKQTQLREAARQYRAQSRPVIGRVVRSDA